jgi:PAS domain S-box-containing protein
MTKSTSWNRSVLVACSAVIVTLLATGVTSYRELQAAKESQWLVRRTYDVLGALQDLLSSLTTLESSARAFALTENRSFLDDYHGAIATSQQHQIQLRDLIRNEPQHEERMRALAELARQKVEFSDEVIRRRETQGMERAADLIRQGGGVRIMDSIRTAIDEWQQEENQLLEQRSADAQRRSDDVGIVVILGTALGLLSVVAAGWAVERESAIRGVTEISVQVSEMKFRGIVESSPDAMVIVDGEGRIVLVNAETERLFGYPRSEMIGNAVDMLVPDRFRPKHPGHRQGYTAHPRTRAMGEGLELWGLRKDGTQFPVEISLSPIKTPEGTLVASAIRDVTESKRAQRQLRASELKFRGILESAPDAMVIVDAEGRINLVNPETERMFGYPRGELVGQFIEVLVPERLHSEHPRHRSDYGAHPRTRTMGEGRALWGLRKDGTEFAVEISLSPLETPDGMLTVAAVRDITKRKALDELLRQSEQNLSLMVHGVTDYAIYMLDAEGRISTWNEGAQRIKGYASEEILGQHFSKFYNQEDKEAGIPDKILQQASRAGRFEDEGWRVRKNGSTFFASMLVTALRDANGRLKGFGNVTRDITDSKKKSAELARAVEELQRSNDELKQFAYVASHDLQEPLRMVASYTQLLAKRYGGKLDQDADEFINFAVDGCRRMQSLIADLLAYSRAGSAGGLLTEVRSEDALEEAMAALQIRIEETHGAVTHDRLPRVAADKRQLTQLFQNLVGNAIKYHGPETPRVHVSASKNGGDEWIFAVKDNGLGIEKQYFEKIFVIFQRLHGRTEFEGTGIGLAICKKIVERHGGRIWLESQPGKGSTFFFSLKGVEK